MNDILFVNKPKGMTSFDVCNKIKRALKLKKVGHTGTLDPNATGLMIVLLDRATKANQFLVEDKKEYIATIKLGIETDTLDIDGNIINNKQEFINDIDIEDILKSFLGKSKQIPPMTSAIKVNGKKLYEYQRKGETIEVEPRDIEIYDISLLNQTEDTFTFKAYVSKGTYIRVLAQDILKEMNKIGTLLELQRTRIDDIKLEESDELEDILNNNCHYHSLLEILERRYKTIEAINPLDIMNGKKLKLDLEEEKILFKYNNDVLAIYQKEDDIYRCLRGLL